MANGIKDFLEDLGIIATSGNFNYNNTTYEYNFNNSTTYSNIYVKLDNSDLLEEVPEDFNLTKEYVEVIYRSKDLDFELTLKGNLEDDEYTFYVEKLSNETKEQLKQQEQEEESEEDE